MKTLAIVFLSLIVASASSLLPSYARSSNASTSAAVPGAPQQQLHSSGDIAEHDDGDGDRDRDSRAAKKDKKAAATSATLNLTGSVLVKSKDLPKKASNDIRTFMEDEATLRLLLSGGERVTQKIPTSPSLLEEWASRAERAGGATPTASDAVYDVQRSGLSLPGLKLKGNSRFGTKIIPNPDNGLVDYEVTMIDDTSTASGLSPLVWVYNKFTGGGGGSGKRSGSDDDIIINNTAEGSSSTTTSFTRLTCNVKEDSIAFEAYSDVAVKMKFPSIFSKLTSKIETSAGASIKKTLDRDLGKVMKAIEDAYAVPEEGNEDIHH
eukprot:CAMPEP_0119564402 /NCGR_PEP_ID=MMETSP1352-20130426/26863_1 /TAXON_ID=265584 /ORGANISM="Stauroneis constricta, Strain CCMP1120" /LENGTH=321 /DNA_ID=CAMNT_0007613159 /DNA_START=82 /DNA_END=1047 /DNA_ORIENTATION=+